MAIRSPAAVELTHRRPVPLPRGWTFLTNHAQVLLVVARNSDMRVREISEVTGISERYAYRVLSDLQSAGYVDRVRQGRCNLYRVHPHLALGDPVVAEQSLDELLRMVGYRDGGERAPLVPHRRSA